MHHIFYTPFTPAEMNEQDANGDWLITDAQLRTQPFFDHGPSSIHGIYNASVGSGTSGSLAAETHHAFIMARMIPASTNSAGHEAVDILDVVGGEDRNFDLNEQGSGAPLRNGFPEARFRDGEYLWFHSDIKDVAYPYIYPTFDRIVELGGLNHEN